LVLVILVESGLSQPHLLALDFSVNTSNCRGRPFNAELYTDILIYKRWPFMYLQCSSLEPLGCVFCNIQIKQKRSLSAGRIGVAETQDRVAGSRPASHCMRTVDCKGGLNTRTANERPLASVVCVAEARAAAIHCLVLRANARLFGQPPTDFVLSGPFYSVFRVMRPVLKAKSHCDV
jgi:hypothetical protein